MRNACSLPEAELLTVTHTASTRLVTILCPICGRRHTHGWPYAAPTIGARAAHCHRPHVPPGAWGSYYIDTPSTVPSRDRPDHPEGQPALTTTRHNRAPRTPCAASGCSYLTRDTLCPLHQPDPQPITHKKETTR